MSHPVYLLSGDPFLASEALGRIGEEEGADPAAEASFDAGVSAAELLGALGTASLFGGRRLVVVWNAHELKKEAVDALSAYLESPSPDSILVLLSPGRSRLYARVKETGAVMTLEAPRGRRLVSWLRTRARDHWGLKLDDRGGWALIDAVGTGLRELDGALRQLATAVGQGARVGAPEVRRIFLRSADERIYVLTDAVGERRLAPAMTATRRLLDQGEPALVLFGAISGHVKRLLRARAVLAAGGDLEAELGLPKWRAGRLERAAEAYREDELIAAIEVLALTDVEMKGGDLPPEVALERAVVWVIEGTGVPAG